MSYLTKSSLMPLPMIHPDIFKGDIYTQRQAQQINSHIYSNTAPSSIYETAHSTRIGGGGKTMFHCYFGNSGSSIIG